jgi:Peptidase family M48
LPAGSDIGHRYVFGLAAALSACALGVTAATITTTLASVHRASAGPRQVVLAGIRFTYPTVNGAEALLFVLAMSAAAVIATIIRAAWRQIRAHRRFAAVLEPVESLDRDPRVGVIQDPRPQAFCAGYLRPAVYVSRRAVELLSDSELDAVLAHEHHHRRVRDPLRIACGRVLSQALFFVPVLKPLCDRYADVAELSADRAAVRASAGREAPLASALLAFDDNAPPGTNGISPERVDSLLGQPTRWRLPAWLLAGSVTVLAALTVVIWWISESAHAHATLNLPIVSSRPCLVLMSIVPAAGCLRALTRLLGSRETDRRKPTARAAPTSN